MEEVDWEKPPWKLARRYGAVYQGVLRSDAAYNRKDVLLFWGHSRVSSVSLMKYLATALLALPYFAGLVAGVFLLTMVDVIITSTFVLSSILLALGFFSMRRRGAKTKLSTRNGIDYFKAAWDQSEKIDKARSSVVIRLFRNPKALLYVTMLTVVAIQSSALLFAASLFLVNVSHLATGLLSWNGVSALLFMVVGLVPNAVTPFYLAVLLVILRSGVRKTPYVSNGPLILLSSALTLLAIYRSVAGFRLGDWVSLPAAFIQWFVILLGGLQTANMAYARRKRVASHRVGEVGWHIEEALLVYVILTLLIIGGSFAYSLLVFTLVGSWFWYSAVKYLQAVQKSPKTSTGRVTRESLALLASFVVIALYGYLSKQSPFEWMATAGFLAVGFLSLPEGIVNKVGWVLLGVKEVERATKVEDFDSTG
jgi:hypothetical protein